MNVTVNASGSREKVRATPTTTPAAKKPRSAPKQQESQSTAVIAAAITSDGDDDIPDTTPLAVISAGSKSLSR